MPVNNSSSSSHQSDVDATLTYTVAVDISNHVNVSNALNTTIKAAIRKYMSHCSYDDYTIGGYSSYQSASEVAKKVGKALNSATAVVVTLAYDITYSGVNNVDVAGINQTISYIHRAIIHSLREYLVESSYSVETTSKGVDGNSMELISYSG